MTRDEIMALEIGPETDALVACATGKPGTWAWKVCINGRWTEARTWMPFGWSPSEPPKGWYAGRMPCPYSTDIRAAMEAQAALPEEKREAYAAQLIYHVLFDLRSSRHLFEAHWAVANAKPLDRCKAILLAMTFENDV